MVDSGGSIVELNVRVLIANDGSRQAREATRVAAALFPAADATIVSLWSAAFGDADVRRRLQPRASDVEGLIALMRDESELQAARIAGDGAEVARRFGWEAQEQVRESPGGEGFLLAEMARESGADLMVLGARGLSGARAALGSTSDIAVHSSSVPVLVVPGPLLSHEDTAASGGPAIYAFDGSPGARAALDFGLAAIPDRRPVVAVVGDEGAESAAADALAASGRNDGEVVGLQPRGPGARGVADAIDDCAFDHGAAVVVCGSRGRSAARELLTGSVAMALLHRVHRPTIVVP